MAGLKERLTEAGHIFAQVTSALNSSTVSVPSVVREDLMTCAGVPVSRLTELLAAREAAWAVLESIDRIPPQAPTPSDPESVVFHGIPLSFPIARLLACEAFLSLTWALADEIAEHAGRIMCTEAHAKDPRQPPQLVASFLGREGKYLAVLSHTMLRRVFGWPVCLSYGLRNIFIHDGAIARCGNFFAGPTRTSGTAISDDGWDVMLERTQKQGVDHTYMRATEPWPWSKDLRALLSICQREMDEALGLVFLSAAETLKVHVGLLLGEH